MSKIDWRTQQLAGIEMRIAECEQHGNGKIVIFIENYKIKNWQVIKTDKITEVIKNK